MKNRKIYKQILTLICLVMKRTTMLLLIYTMVFLPFISTSLAYADTSLYFNEDGTPSEYNKFASNCHHATNCSTKVYSDKYLTEPIATIPKGTYVHTESEFWPLYEDETGYYRWGGSLCTYMLTNGTKGKGWIDSRHISSAYIQLPTGEGVSLLRIQTGESSDDVLETDPLWGDMTIDTPSEAKAVKKETPNTENTKETPHTESSKETSVIRRNSEGEKVGTGNFAFTQNVPEDKKNAIIYAPRTGKCSLRSKASDSSKVIKQCKAGRVVSVHEYGSKFCLIDYDGVTGYVLTNCLQFRNSNVETIGTGLLTYNGKATGRTTINIRLEANGESHKIGELKTGTEVTLFSINNGWYEIEYNGIHGFVQEKYLTVQPVRDNP